MQKNNSNKWIYKFQIVLILLILLSSCGNNKSAVKQSVTKTSSGLKLKEEAAIPEFEEVLKDLNALGLTDAAEIEKVQLALDTCNSAIKEYQAQIQAAKKPLQDLKDVQALNDQQALDTLQAQLVPIAQQALNDGHNLYYKVISEEIMTDLNKKAYKVLHGSKMWKELSMFCYDAEVAWDWVARFPYLPRALGDACS